MKSFLGLVAISCLFFVHVNSAKLPSYLKKCKRGATGGKCVVENAMAALAQLGPNGEPLFKLQGLHPFNIEKMALQATPSLKIDLYHAQFFGYDEMQIKDGSITDNELTLSCHVPRIDIDAEYTINGKIQVLPIKGEGTGNFTLTDFDLEYKAKLFTEERKGKKYFQVRADANSVVEVSNVKNARFLFNNLFGGDEGLGKEMNQFMNDNWKDVFDELKGTMEQTIAYAIFPYFINGYFHYVPIDELFD